MEKGLLFLMGSFGVGNVFLGVPCFWWGPVRDDLCLVIFMGIWWFTWGLVAVDPDSSMVNLSHLSGQVCLI